MLLPLNLKTSKSVALSIIKIGQSYSIRKVNNRPFIYIHKRKDGYSKFSEDRQHTLVFSGEGFTL